MQPALWQQLNDLTDDKRIRNSQPTNLLRATACYFHHILIIGTIRNILDRGGVRARRFESHKKHTHN